MFDDYMIFESEHAFYANLVRGVNQQYPNLLLLSQDGEDDFELTVNRGYGWTFQVSLEKRGSFHLMAANFRGPDWDDNAWVSSWEQAEFEDYMELREIFEALNVVKLGYQTEEALVVFHGFEEPPFDAELEQALVGLHGLEEAFDSHWIHRFRLSENCLMEVCAVRDIPPRLSVSGKRLDTRAEVTSYLQEVRRSGDLFNTLLRTYWSGGGDAG